MIDFLQGGSTRSKWLNWGKSCCIRAKWLYSGKKVVFVKSGCILAKEDLLGQKWLYLGKVVMFGQSGCNPEKVVVFG